MDRQEAVNARAIGLSVGLKTVGVWTLRSVGVQWWPEKYQLRQCRNISSLKLRQVVTGRPMLDGQSTQPHFHPSPRAMSAHASPMSAGSRPTLTPVAAVLSPGARPTVHSSGFVDLRTFVADGDVNVWPLVSAGMFTLVPTGTVLRTPPVVLRGGLRIAGILHAATGSSAGNRYEPALRRRWSTSPSAPPGMGSGCVSVSLAVTSTSAPSSSSEIVVASESISQTPPASSASQPSASQPSASQPSASQPSASQSSASQPLKVDQLEPKNSHEVTSEQLVKSSSNIDPITTVKVDSDSMPGVFAATAAAAAAAAAGTTTAAGATTAAVSSPKERKTVDLIEVSPYVEDDTEVHDVPLPTLSPPSPVSVLLASLEPSLASIAACVRNSVYLAYCNNASQLRIPFLGGGIFFHRLGKDVSQALLARVIVEAAVNSYLEFACEFHLLFVDQDEDAASEMASAWKFVKRGQVLALSARSGQDMDKFAQNRQRRMHSDLVSIACGDMMASNTELEPDDIAWPDHFGKRIFIVNAANCELTWGGGLCGAIARACGGAAPVIAQKLTQMCSQYWRGKLQQLRWCCHSLKFPEPEDVSLMLDSGGNTPDPLRTSRPVTSASSTSASSPAALMQSSAASIASPQAVPMSMASSPSQTRAHTPTKNNSTPKKQAVASPTTQDAFKLDAPSAPSASALSEVTSMGHEKKRKRIDGDNDAPSTDPLKEEEKAVQEISISSSTSSPASVAKLITGSPLKVARVSADAAIPMTLSPSCSTGSVVAAAAGSVTPQVTDDPPNASHVM